jgi:diapolycopene oxygenase
MTEANSNRIGVVGGGLGGLAAAVTLAARGYRVVLFERNGWLGGKAAVLEAKGFRFDMGPTILTVPSVLRRVFSEAGRKLEDELDLIQLDPQWRCFFEDGTRLDLVEDVAQMGANLDALAPGTPLGDRYKRFMAISERLHETSDKFFFWRPIGSFMDTFNVRGAFHVGILRDILSMRLGRTVRGVVHGSLREPRVCQMAEHFTQYVGSSPMKSPAILCSIAHMQTAEGIWYPRGGTAAVPHVLAKTLQDLGGEARTGTTVSRVTHAGGRVTGVVTDAGEEIKLDAVVSNMDAVRTHRELIGGEVWERFSRRRKYEPACSGVVLYLGLDRTYDHLLHHCFVFSRDPKEEFDAIYSRGEPAPDPTCYVCAPSRTEPEVAPQGGEALYVLVHTPHLRPNHDWRRTLPEYRDTILAKLARTGGMKDIEKHIVFEQALTPADIHERYHVLSGAIYGLASHGRFRGAFKPPNRSPDLAGLYLAGGAAHPGPGMPMVLMSGWIAADALDRDGLVRRER